MTQTHINPANPLDAERGSELNRQAEQLGKAPDPDAVTSAEVVDSLTGFDEVAIEKHFGKSLEDLAENTGATFLRALVFVLERRKPGGTDAEAFKAAQGLRFGELKERFKKADGDDDADLPGSPVGEGSG